jgi:hypothetical protein
VTEAATLHQQLLAYFQARDSAAGVVARRILGRPRPDDDEIADHLIRQRRRRSSLDGSIDHALVPTAQALRELVDLGAPTDHAAVVRLSGFLIGRQDAPGRWGELEGRGTGFFSPGPLDHAVAPLALPWGVTFADEQEARCAASLFALRSVLRAGHDERRAVHEHLDALLAIGPEALGGPLAWLALGALALAPPQFRHHAVTWSDHLVSPQGVDGGFPAVPVVHALDALALVPQATARGAIVRALPAVAVTADTHEETALVLARAVKVVDDGS